MKCPYCEKEIKRGETTVELHSGCYANGIKSIRLLCEENIKLKAADRYDHIQSILNETRGMLGAAREVRDRYKALIDKIHARCLNTPDTFEGYATFWADVMLMMPCDEVI